ncbi:MAG TPA: type 4a pilus biogenesis protein PilO [Tepidisphaeraceae bacterium]|jgi:Tfp pilus assembly protein PilO
MRTLQSQAEWCARAQWVLAGGLVAALAAFYLLWYRPQTQKLDGLRTECVAREQELRSNQGNMQKLPVVAMELESLRSRLENAKKMPKQPDLGQFIRDVTQIGKQVGLDRKWSYQPGMPRKLELYSELPIQLHFEGDFMSVFSFLRATEGMQRLTRVRNVSIKTIDSKLGQVEVQLAVNIYYTEG